MAGSEAAEGGSPTLIRQRMWTTRKSHVSGAIRGAYNPASMLGFHRQTIHQLEHATSVLRARVQRLEGEQAASRARLESERQLQMLTAHIAAAAHAAPVIGAAMERFAQAMCAPLPVPPRGRAGGVARAKSEWRHLDGTFMPESQKEAAFLKEYERYAKGGRARATEAKRSEDGTFLPVQAT